jgi:hypothetical protein
MFMGRQKAPSNYVIISLLCRYLLIFIAKEDITNNMYD